MTRSASTIALLASVALGAAEVPAANPANQFGDPSFEQGLGIGKSGKVQVYYEGAPAVDAGGTKAHTGQIAIGLPGTDANGKRVFFQMGAAVTPGGSYQLKAFFRAEKDGGRVHLQVNLNDSSKVFQAGQVLTTAWEERVLSFVVPADAKPDAILILQGGASDNVVWMDDIFFGEAK